jgi:hypothetical protein
MLLLTILSCFFTFVFGQSKTETIEGLNVKLKDKPVDKDNLGPTIRYLSIYTNGSFIVTQKRAAPTLIPDFDHQEQITRFRGNLKDLDPKTVRIVKSSTTRDLYYVQANCTKGSCITQSNEYGVVNSSAVTFAYIDVITEPGIDVKMAKAFKHLISLYGGKGDLF